MTAKRGTLWKTSWRRQKTPVPQAPVPMWFFNNFQIDLTGRVWYQQPLGAPGIGDTTGGSFWAGMIAASITGPSFGASIQRADSPPNFQDWRLRVTSLAPIDPLEFGAEGQSGGVVQASQSDPVSSLGVISPVLRAIVTMLVVEDLGNGTRRQTLWVDGAVRVSGIFASPYLANAARRGAALPGDGFLNSWAGGNVLPTTDEIQEWFSASRYALPAPSAQAIPGKTLDRFDAGAVPGTVPSPLVNLSVGQNMLGVSEGVSPAFANTLFDASFAY
jgi:hypothetical protein